jgi:acetyl esterase/lipase
MPGFNVRMPVSCRYLFAVAAAFSIGSPCAAQFPTKTPLDPHVRSEDVIYGRKDGVALTMDVYSPKKNPNGAGVILCVSAEYRSGKEMLNLFREYTAGAFLNRGYVVFLVMHGSQPRFTVPEIVGQMHRAVRFIKANAKGYGVDPKRLGITGASSGGHLSLMMGCAGRGGAPDDEDEVDKQSSKVAAVACIFPVTDFLEYDKEKLPAKWERFRALFDVREMDRKTNRLERITPEMRTQLGREYSPLHCFKQDAAPTFIVHGDADELVPIRQSRELNVALKKCGALCELVEVKGMGHTIPEALTHLPRLADWIDKQLVQK